MALVLALAMLNGGCILIPEMKDRLVELAVGGTTSAVFTVQGVTTSVNEIQIVDVGSQLNLAQILADNGIDVSQVTNISLASVSYRITDKGADPNPAQEITGWNITVQRGAGPIDNLVVGFSAAPGAPSGFQGVPLTAAGVATINTMLDDILGALPGPPANPTATFRLTGNSLSAPNFEFELKITVSITGTVQVTVPT